MFRHAKWLGVVLSLIARWCWLHVRCVFGVCCGGSWGRSWSGLSGIVAGVAATAAALSACLLSLLSKEQGFSAVLICMYLQSTVWSRVVPDAVAPLLLVQAPGATPPSSRAPQRETPALAAIFRLVLFGAGAVALALWRLSRNAGGVTIFTEADNSAAFAEHTSERVMTYAYYHWLQAVPLVFPYRLIHDMSFTTLKVSSEWARGLAWVVGWPGSVGACARGCCCCHSLEPPTCICLFFSLT